MPQTTESAETATGALRNRSPRFAPLAASLLIVLLLGGVALVVRVAGRPDPGFGTGGEPPLLRLTTPSGAVSVDTADSASGRSRYVLAGPLPGGRPDPAPVYRFGADEAPADLADRLARALGLPGSPSRTPTGWQLAVDQRVLTLQDGGSWAWSLGPSEVVADSPVQCFRAPCPYETPNSDRTNRGQPAPPPAVAEQIAKDALTTLGLPTETLSSTSVGPLTQVRAPRPVDGKDTDGFSTTLSIGSDRRINGGNGWLGQPTARGASYPLVNAAEAFKRLQAQPYAEILLCRPQAGGGCAPAPQVRVTGAKLGLMMAFDSIRPLLVPAWLFTVEGQVDPVAVVAVESRFLRTPTTPKPSSATSGSPGAGGGSLPKSEPPAAPSAVPPAGPTSLHNPATPPPG